MEYLNEDNAKRLSVTQNAKRGSVFGGSLAKEMMNFEAGSPTHFMGASQLSKIEEQDETPDHPDRDSLIKPKPIEPQKLKGLYIYIVSYSN